MYHNKTITSQIGGQKDKTSASVEGIKNKNLLFQII